MVLSLSDVQQFLNLAYIEANEATLILLASDMNQVLDYVGQLQQVDTSSVTALQHPLEGYQTLRQDQVTSTNVSKDLARIAPDFEDPFYLVPKVIDRDIE